MNFFKVSVLFSALIIFFSNVTLARTIGCEGFLTESGIFDPTGHPDQAYLSNMLTEGKLFQINTYSKTNPLSGRRDKANNSVISAYLNTLSSFYRLAINWYVQGSYSYYKIFTQELRNNNRLYSLDANDPKLSPFERQFLEAKNTINSVFQKDSLIVKQGTILFKGLYQRRTEPFMVPEKGSLWAPKQIVSLTTSPNAAWDFATSKIGSRSNSEFIPIILVIEVAEDMPLIPGGVSYADFIASQNIGFEVVEVYRDTAHTLFSNFGIDSNIVHLRARHLVD